MRLHIAVLATVLVTGCGGPPASQDEAGTVQDPAGSPADAATKTTAQADAGPQGLVVAGADTPLGSPDGKLFRLRNTTVSCASPSDVGLARALYPRWTEGVNLAATFTQMRCLPPIGPVAGPPVTYQLSQIEDTTWRGSLDGGGTFVGGNLRVAELRTKADGQDLIEYVAADDLIPVHTTQAESPPEPGAAAGQ